MAKEESLRKKLAIWWYGEPYKNDPNDSIIFISHVTHHPSAVFAHRVVDFFKSLIFSNPWVITIVGGVIVALVSYFFLGIGKSDPSQVSVVDVQYELQDSDGGVIQRKSWQDNRVLDADPRNIERMLVSFKLRNPGSSPAFAKIENYAEIFSNPYVVSQRGDFLDETYAIPTEGDTGFIFAVDITPFTRVLPIDSNSQHENIEFYDKQGNYIDTAQASIASTYGMSIPYKVEIYNRNKKLIDVVQFSIRCRAQISDLRITLDENNANLSKSITFECLPVL